MKEVSIDHMPPETASSFWERVPRWAIYAAAAVALCVSVRLNLSDPWSDFPGFYVGAELTGTPDLYNPAAARQLLQDLSDRPEVLAIVRVPANYLLAVPLTTLSYQAAERLWMSLMAVCAALFLWIYPDRPRYFLLAAGIFLPLWHSIWIGQDTALLLLTFAVGLRLLDSGRPFLGGLSLAVLCIKPYLVLLFPVAFAARRSWRALAGMASGGAAMVALSFALQGSAWIQEWMHLILSPETSPSVAQMVSIRAIVANWGIEGWYWPLAAMILLGGGAVAVKPPLSRALAIALAAGVLVSGHAYVHDVGLLFPAILMGLAAAPAAGRWAAMALLLPITYLLGAFEQMALVPLLGVTLLASMVWSAHQTGEAAPEPSPSYPV